MASRSFTLPPLKLTKRPTISVTEKKTLHHGVANVCVQTPPEPACFSEVDSSELPPTLLSKITPETPHDEPTVYEIESKIFYCYLGSNKKRITLFNNRIPGYAFQPGMCSVQ